MDVLARRLSGQSRREHINDVYHSQLDLYTQSIASLYDYGNTDC